MSTIQTAPVTPDLGKAKQEAVAALLRPNSSVLGVGIGTKGVGGEEADSVRVYVLDKDYVTRWGLVPPDFLGVPTHVIQVGRFGRSGGRPMAHKGARSQPGSPIRVSTSASNVNEGQRGTLGAVVADDTGRRYILSCNHILTVNGRVRTDPNAEVVSADFVGSENSLAHPGAFVSLKRDQGNAVDCAIAGVGHRAPVLSAFPDGTLRLNPKGAIDPAPDMNVEKVGAVTGHTKGTIVDVDADLYIDYSFGTYRFDHQTMIDGGYDDLNNAFANAGDSGSIAVDSQTHQPAALIFAASGRFAVACPLRTGSGTGVLDLLELQLKRPLHFVAE